MDDINHFCRQTPNVCRKLYLLNVSRADLRRRPPLQGGFQAEVTVKADRPIKGWTVSWAFPGGQRIIQLRNGSHTPDRGRRDGQECVVERRAGRGRDGDVRFHGVVDQGERGPQSCRLCRRDVTAGAGVPLEHA
ncbi:hypothetical protein GCM10010404_42850 [Nonomuraea africana]